MNFGYQVVRLWEVPVQTLLTGDLFLVPLAPLGCLPRDVSVAEALGPVIRQLVERLLAEAPEEQKKELVTAAYTLTGLRVPRGVAGELFRGVKAMHESDTYQAILDEGAARVLRRMIIRWGQKHLGPADPGVLARLEAIENPDRLEELVERVNAISTWQDLLPPS